MERTSALEPPQSAEKALTLSVEVALPSRDLCGNGRANGFKRSRLVKAQRGAAMLAAYAALSALPATLQRPPFPAGTRVLVEALVRRDPLWSARRLDDDNFWRGCKGALDGLADAGVVADDRQFTLGRIVWDKAEPLRGGVLLLLKEVQE
jgi:hypothetical protein